MIESNSLENRQPQRVHPFESDIFRQIFKDALTSNKGIIKCLLGGNVTKETKKRYSLLYLPTGRYIEIFAPPVNHRTGVMCYRILINTRQVLSSTLKTIMEGQYHPDFYKHNELLSPEKLQSCFFSFQRIL